MTVQEKAQEFLQYFETRKRENGEEFITTKEGRPNELIELIYEAHQNMLPDDYKYKFIFNSLEIIAEMEDVKEFPKIKADISNYDLLKWLSSNVDRCSYVDEAVMKYGYSESIIENIMFGQIKEKEEVFYSVLESLQNIVAEDESNGE